MKLEITPIEIKLKVPWKLSRNTSVTKTNFIITINNKYKSEVAPNIRYGETVEKIIREFDEFKLLTKEMSFQEALDQKNWAHSLRFGLESTWLTKLADEHGQTLGHHLGLKRVDSVPTSYSLPIMDIGDIKNYLAPLARFKSLKIKLNSEQAIDIVREVVKHTNAPLRLDGNEAWSDVDQFLRFEEKLKGMNIEFIEQPLPAASFKEYVLIKKKTPHIIMADESLEDQDDMLELSTGFHAINVKLMKSGSLLKAKNQLIEARKVGLKTMIGCMIETSLGISYAMELASLADYFDLDGFILIDEDPFKLLSERDGNIVR